MPPESQYEKVLKMLHTMACLAEMLGDRRKAEALREAAGNVSAMMEAER